MKIIVSAGGTGGHIYPALAIIKKFEEKEKNLDILYIGTHNRMEKDLIPKLGYKYEALEMYGLSKNIMHDFKTLYCMFKAQKKCEKIIKNFKPDVVLGIGGYVTYPVINAAHKLKVKTFIHEQNSIPGKTNIILSKKVDLVGVSFFSSEDYFKSKRKVIYTGNPCGENAINMKAIPKSKFDLSKTKKLVIIVAGSLGSSSINKKMQDFVMNSTNKNYEILYITGNKYYESFISDLKIPKNVKVVPFVDNLAGLMKNADLIVTRAGASTMSEIIALGLPAIYIPSPYVANNHQYYNALELKKKGAGELITEEELNSDILTNKIDELLNNKESYLKMKNSLKKLESKNSSEIIYNSIKELLK